MFGILKFVFNASRFADGENSWLFTRMEPGNKFTRLSIGGNLVQGACTLSYKSSILPPMLVHKCYNSPLILITCALFLIRLNNSPLVVTPTSIFLPVTPYQSVDNVSMLANAIIIIIYIISGSVYVRMFVCSSGMGAQTTGQIWVKLGSS